MRARPLDARVDCCRKLEDARLAHRERAADRGAAGRLPGALRIVLPRGIVGRIEFRVGDGLASIADGKVVEGAIDGPDAIVVGDTPAFYCLMVDRDLDAVSVDGDAEAVRAMIAALPPVRREDTAVAPAG